ncbi:MAG: hypothetical protein NG784_12825 [Candidatus Jettenia sp.]|nr:hypothetical protein [Candidatus Jettenia sp.]
MTPGSFRRWGLILVLVRGLTEASDERSSIYEKTFGMVLYDSLFCLLHLLIGCGGGGTEIKQTTTNSSLGQELQDLDAAYQKKIITEEEYKKAKEKLLKKYAK